MMSGAAAMDIAQTSNGKRGAFILFEGLDRTGKTTQSQLLCDKITADPELGGAKHMRFPNRTTEIGKMIDSYLKSAVELDDHAIHLLFAANRWEASSEMERVLASGTTIVCDRYSYSGIAFSAAKGLDLNWCLAPEAGLVAPDLVVHMTLPADVAEARGGYGGERYEKSEFQAKVGKVFQQLKGKNWVEIDANRPIETIHEEINAVVQAAIRQVADKPLQRL